jgi:hypothetical protein
MPARPDHLPSHRERNAMQKMSIHGALPLVKLYPTGKVTLERMLAKGWIAVGGSPQTYRITPAGEAALKAQIPIWKRTSPAETG